MVSKRLKRIDFKLSDFSMPRDREAERLCNETSDIDEMLRLLQHPDPRLRVMALKNICPCRMNGQDIPEFWDHIFKMCVTERDTNVRKQLLHTLCDGSPTSRELEVIAAIESLNQDTRKIPQQRGQKKTKMNVEEKNIKRLCQKVLSNYRRTGEWNIL